MWRETDWKLLCNKIVFNYCFEGVYTLFIHEYVDNPFKVADLAISAKSVAERYIKFSPQPCNLHRQTLAVEWPYWRAQWLLLWGCICVVSLSLIFSLCLSSNTAKSSDTHPSGTPATREETKDGPQSFHYWFNYHRWDAWSHEITFSWN